MCTKGTGFEPYLVVKFRDSWDKAGSFSCNLNMTVGHTSNYKVFFMDTNAVPPQYIILLWVGWETALVSGLAGELVGRRVEG